MEIAVDGWRAGAADWDAVRNLPADKLPALTKEQREVAKKLGVAEADYARSALAGEHSRQMLLAKAERLARLLSKMLEAMNVAASVESVTLRTFHEKFDVLLKAGNDVIPLRIAEEVVDDLFEAGSVDAEQRLGRILSGALQGRIRQQ
jgi:hypothetical protein